MGMVDILHMCLVVGGTMKHTPIDDFPAPTLKAENEKLKVLNAELLEACKMARSIRWGGKYAEHNIPIFETILKAIEKATETEGV